jgi:hypothetical protein
MSYSLRGKPSPKKGKSKLTPEQIKSIQSDVRSYSTIAKEYKIGIHSVFRFKHLDGRQPEARPQKGIRNSPATEFKPNQPSAFKGKKHTQESNEKNAVSHRGKPSLKKGKYKLTLEQIKALQSDNRHDSIIAKEYKISEKSVYNYKHLIF